MTSPTRARRTRPSRPATTASSSSAVAPAACRSRTTSRAWASTTRSSRPTRRPAACSASSRSSSACSRGPSRTPAIAHDSREYERYDFNSLVAFEPQNRAVMPGLMDGSSEFPSRAEMEAGMVEFVRRTGLRVRYETPWQGTSRDGELFVLHTPDGRLPHARADLRGRHGRAAPARRHPRHRARRALRRHARAASYAGKRLFIMGKANSGFELASGLLQWASPIILASPRPAQLSVNLHSLGGVRARYVQPWEDAELGGGVFILDASIERIERHADGIAVHTRRIGHRRAVRGRGRRGHRRHRLHRAPARPARRWAWHLRAQRPARHDQPLRVGHRCRASSSPAPSPRASRASRSSASRPTPAPSTGTATTARLAVDEIAARYFGISPAAARASTPTRSWSGC